MFKIIMTVILVLGFNTVNAKTILVFGDSISAGYGINVEEGWVALLQHKLSATKKPFAVVNESISGETTAGGLARIDAALAKFKPDIVLLELGANDGLRGLSPQVMQNNLSAMVTRAEKAGAKVLLLGIRIPPNYGKRYADMFYGVFNQLALNLKIAWVPFMLEDVALNPQLMQADGLHPNAAAQPIMLAHIWQYLEPLLQ